MKKIIANKTYDTETAKLIHEYENKDYPADIDYIRETLYRKRTGEYFLHAYGNANTKYATDLGGNRFGSGERLIPLTYEQARDWAQYAMDGDAYEAEFGDVEEDGDAIVSMRISKTADSAIRRAARERGITIGQVIDELAATL